MTLHLVTDNDPVALAWLAFDRAALELGEMYQGHDAAHFSAFDRMEKAMEARRLWEQWQVLFLKDNGGDEPRPAA